MSNAQPDDLFSFAAHARRTDVLESHLAAASTNTERTRLLILHVLPEIQPATDEQIYEAARAVALCTPSGIRSRREELRVEGLIRRAGSSKTEAGRACRTWEVVR